MNVDKTPVVDNTQPTVYTTKDVKRILKCGQRQAYELMNSNDFPSFRINKKLLVERNQFEKWMNRNIKKTVNI